MMNTLKVDNPVGAITSGCNTGFENLSILVEQTTLHPQADEQPSNIKDTNVFEIGKY